MSGSNQSSRTEQPLERWARRLELHRKVKLAGIDADGVLRGKLISKDKFLSAIKSDGLGWCSVVFGWVSRCFFDRYGCVPLGSDLFLLDE